MAANGFAEHSPGGYNMQAALVCEFVMTFMFLFIILGSTDRRASGRVRSVGDRTRVDVDSFDQHPGDQHLGESGAQYRRRRFSSAAGLFSSSGCSGPRRSWERSWRDLLFSGARRRLEEMSRVLADPGVRLL